MSVTSVPGATEVVTTFFDAYSEHDVERMVELCSDNADFHYVPFELWGKQRVIRGDGKVRTIGKVIWTTLIDSFPDLTTRIMYITSDDEGNVAAEVMISGTQAKPFGTMGNQGLHYDLPHVFLFRMSKEGLIEEITGYWDTADWYRQLGRLEVD
ncbi:MAG: nuclear transport factor 2 family protein [Ktedonobacteraceae bacterium]